MKNKSLLLVIVMMVVIILPSFACGNSSNVQSDLHSYINAKATKVLQQLKTDQPKYGAESTSLAIYQNQVETLMKAKSKGFGSFYDEMQLIEGWWVSDGKNIKNVVWIRYQLDAGGYKKIIPDSFGTQSLLIEMHNRLKSVYDYQEKLNWAKICDTTLRQLMVDTRALEMLIDKSGLSYTGWNVKPGGAGAELITGDALGIYDNIPHFGSWTLNTGKGKADFQPADRTAENLLSLISDRDTYETQKMKSNIKPPPIYIPQRQVSDMIVVNQYYLEVGFNIPPGTLALNYSKSSTEVQDLFQKYPDFKKYWEMFEFLGYSKLRCGTFYNSASGKANPEPIVLEVLR